MKAAVFSDTHGNIALMLVVCVSVAVIALKFIDRDKR